MTTLKEQMLAAPEEQLSQPAKDLIIQIWDDNPTAIQLLEAMDWIVYYSLASDFTVSVLDIYLTAALKREEISYEELLPLATWRINND